MGDYLQEAVAQFHFDPDAVLSWYAANADWAYFVFRTVGLLLFVILVIWLIGFVYGSSFSKSEYGPVGIRPHIGNYRQPNDIVVPKDVLPLGVDGMHSDLEVVYSYTDRRGNNKKVVVHKLKGCHIHIRNSKLPSVQSTIYGIEIPENVPTLDVVFPPFEITQPPTEIVPTPPSAKDYASQYNLIGMWTEDDSAPLVSLPASVIDRIRERRAEFILERAKRVRAARERPILASVIGPKLAASLGNRQNNLAPNVMGNYMLRFKFSKNPIFILTSHPDRDLKMTAWLTVLTSAFALVMEAWRPEPPSLQTDRPAISSQPDRTPAIIRR